MQDLARWRSLAYLWVCVLRAVYVLWLCFLPAHSWAPFGVARKQKREHPGQHPSDQSLYPQPSICADNAAYVVMLALTEALLGFMAMSFVLGHSFFC